MSWGREHRWVTPHGSPALRLDEAGLRRLPLGTVREFDLAGVRVSATRHHEDRWQLHSGAVSLEVLAGFESRAKVERAGSTA